MITQAGRLTWMYALWGALLGAGLAGIVWAPALWLTWAITQASQGQIQWQGVRGTVWSGSAQLVLTGGAQSRDAQALPSRLQWNLTPRWVGLRINWQANCCMTEPAEWHLKAGWSTWQIQVKQHTSTWPAALLKGWGAPWNTLQPDGQLQLNTPGLQLHWAEGRMQFMGQAELKLHKVSTRLSASRPIGSYLLQLRGSPEGTATPTLQLSTQQGPLLLSGEGQWIGARLRFKGEASAQAGHEQELNNLLNILGRRQGARSLISLG